jgi:hypothetical protein
MQTNIANDPIRFAYDLLMVMDKYRRLTPLRYNRAQLDYIGKRSKRDLILKARQLGFSTAIQAEMFRLATTGAESTLTMADKDENTAKLRRIIQRYYDHLPPHMPRPIRSEDNASVTVYPIIGSEVSVATAGSRTSGRASSYTRVHGSEVAYWKDADWIIAGALQAVPEHGDTWVVFESTANGTDNWFYTECMRAMRGDSEWKFHFYEWWWDDEYALPLDPDELLEYDDTEMALISKHKLNAEQIKWRRKKQRDLGDLFQQEYPESPEAAFLTSGRGVFQLDKPNLFTACHEDRSIIGFPVTVADDYTATDDSEHVMGIDWGQSPDSTAVSIWDSTSYRKVAQYVTGKRDYEFVIGDIVSLCQHYEVEYIVPEMNSMRMQIEVLKKEIKNAMPDHAPRISPFIMDNKRKDDLVKRMQLGINEGARLLDEPISKHELRTFEASQTSSGLWGYSHPNGGHDDTVVADMLAHYACFQLSRKRTK